MFTPNRWLQLWYDKYNAHYFEGKLPSGAQVQIGWNDELQESDLGQTMLFESGDDEGKLQLYNISLHPQVNQCGKKAVRLVLLHEMCHVKIIHQKIDTRAKQNHGKKFQREMLNLAVAGAFNDLW